MHGSYIASEVHTPRHGVPFCWYVDPTESSNGKLVNHAGEGQAAALPEEPALPWRGSAMVVEGRFRLLVRQT